MYLCRNLPLPPIVLLVYKMRIKAWVLRIHVLSIMQFLCSHHSIPLIFRIGPVCALSLQSLTIHVLVNRALYVGYSSAQLPNIDTVSMMTFVHNDPLPINGLIDKLDFYSRFSGKPLMIGVYRKIAACQYKLLQSTTLNTITIGTNQVCFADVWEIWKTPIPIFVAYISPSCWATSIRFGVG